MNEAMRKGFRRRGVSLLVMIGLTVNLLLGYKVYSDATVENPKDDGYQAISNLMFVIQELRQNYVDGDKVTYGKLVEGALKGMLHELDPFSSYENPKRYEDMIEQTEGQFGGIGVVVTMKNKMLEVVAPLEDTPGFEAGIHAGDLIVKIGDKDTRSMSLSECVNLLKGVPGTKVAITIYRKSEDLTKDLEIERAVIKLSGVKGPTIIENEIAYLRISQFVGTTAAKLENALREMKKENPKGLILDLRGNPGGLLSSAISVCSNFLEKGKLVVFTEGKRESQKREYFAMDCEKVLDLPMVILIDQNSASASEIVAGCLQDYKRAVLVGETSFGKGSVQSVIPLPNKGGAIRFTTARYYTPSERVIHGEGIDPDIVVKIRERDLLKLAHQRSKYPGVIKPDEKGAVTDVTLERAVGVLKGICLFSEARGDD